MTMSFWLEWSSFETITNYDFYFFVKISDLGRGSYSKQKYFMIIEEERQRKNTVLLGS